MTKPIEPRQRIDIQAILAAGSSSKSLWRNRWVRWGSAAAAAAVLVLLLSSIVGPGRNAVRYVTAKAARGDLTVIVTATGSVQPTTKVDVSSELSGTVRKVLVDYNSQVTPGQTLAELDTDKLKATVDSSRAKLASAKAKLADAEATVKEKQSEAARKRTLATRQVSSTHDLEAAEAALARAIAAVASAKADIGLSEADLVLNETNLAKARIVSPIGGVVLKRNVDPGQTVASSLQAPVLFSIAEDLKQMELQVDVDEADVGKVVPGQRATFGVDAFPERKFPATIRDLRYASETIQGVVTYKAVLMIDNSELLLRPGMTATAEIRITELKDVLLVPNTALRYAPPAAAPKTSLLRRVLPGVPQFRPPSAREEAGPNRTLHVLVNNQPAPVKVVIGASDGKRTEVRSGEIRDGDSVVVDQVTQKP